MLSLGVLSSQNTVYTTALELLAGASSFYFDAQTLASITSSAGLVSNWADYFGRPVNAVAGANKPTTGSVNINGKNALGFSTASDDRLTITPGASPSGTSQYDLYIIANSTATSGSNAFLYGSGNSAGANQQLFLSFVSNSYRDGWNASALSIAASINTPYLIQASWNGSTKAISLNGGTQSTLSATGLNRDTSSAIGNAPGGGKLWNGSLGAMAIFPTALSSTYRTMLISYLKTRWGIA